MAPYRRVPTFKWATKNTGNDRISLSIANTGSTSLGLNDEALTSATAAKKQFLLWTPL